MVKIVNQKSFKDLENWDSWPHIPNFFRFLSRSWWRCVRKLFKTDIGPACDHLSLGSLTSGIRRAVSVRFPPTLPLLSFSSEPAQISYAKSCASPQKWTHLFLPIQWTLFFQQRSSPVPHLTEPHGHTLIKNPWALKFNLTQAIK